ncbi:RNA polymerase sigma factor [Sphingobacterium griseoflavum]|uniref:RNA polymerase sigma factor 70 region 4 type 2 domain-containing protein n=1 Tax=Sphingobacterium griseoflavum TaxID=1474952 RepID=A0ABQ3HYI3_9SPHI|nr:sigma-70 family RNA polymerase sigma factor [Sphingobacterium griseoflavum]GHE44416.1 hypothetical protein GCM10017764_29520 [Sphingobacterium griseoflavum]
MNKTLQQQQLAKHIALLQQGDERGLDFIYRRFFGYLFAKSFRATQDDCVAESIAQEAFLRLWMFRNKVKDMEGILTFLKTQVRSAIHAFYSKTRNRFHRSLLRLDAVEDYQEFLLGYEVEEEDESDLVYLEELEEEKRQRLDQLNKFLPNLNQQQQLFIKLCLKYSFNYERIAYYLGGISDYEVSLQVEKAIKTLRSVFNSSQKMKDMNRQTIRGLQGDFNAKQLKILHMRYELHWSFEQMAEALQLDSVTVKKLFVQAHAKIKTTSKIS